MPWPFRISGVITQITLPSGREIDYTLNANAQVSGVSADVNSTATTLASSITYLPFGPMDSMTYGNSLVLTANYDQDYWPTSRSVNTVFSHTYDTDDNGNIIQKGAWTYDYDALNRLDDQNDGSTTTAFTYDAIGNRLTENDGSTTTYTYPSTSSKLSSVGSDSYTYDAAGNITGNGVLDFVWDAAARLEEAKTAGTSTVVGAYVYDYANKRTSKTVSGTTTHYVYGQGGLLYGEYDNTGALIREYVYLNGQPLAQIDAGSPESLIYLHTDHLMTPRYATNTSGSTVWTWDSGAFGAEAPTGSATVNLRFPGQYYDGETSLHYNWNRYYDPATGRYISSDPIGLEGGLATYNYAGASPTVFYDPEGLDLVLVGDPGLGKYNSGCLFEMAAETWIRENGGTSKNTLVRVSTGQDVIIALDDYARSLAEDGETYGTIDGLQYFGHSVPDGLLTWEQPGVESFYSEERRGKTGKNARFVTNVAPEWFAPDTQVQFWGCNAGYGENSFAQQFSNHVGVNVIAATTGTRAYVMRNGKLGRTTETFPNSNYKGPVYYVPDNRKWKTFTPETISPEE